MVKKKKRGQAGSAAQYLTRNQALQKLQLKLPLFRRLCILKGIHPREPKNKPQGANKTYYHVKDVNFLLHEPLMEKFRDQQAYERKIKRARAYKNRDLLKRLIKRRPGYRLDHLVKERYPSFIDALRDLDDALSLVFLFATLPAEQQHKIPARQVELSRRLALEWQAWVVRTNSLRKVFVAVRGYYFQVRGDGADRHVDHAAPRLAAPRHRRRLPRDAHLPRVLPRPPPLCQLQALPLHRPQVPPWPETGAGGGGRRPRGRDAQPRRR
uniref:Pescadillo n=1 Tax=Tetraselmis sp. GSL018 TaxID=582737 RepID=A0A061RK94_9CHLO